MSAGPPLRVRVADPGTRRDGWLAADEGNDADVPFAFGDDWPFADRALTEIAVGPRLHALSRAGTLQWLLDGRRTLQAQGVLRVARPPSSAGVDALAALARLAGLAPHAPANNDLAFAKPDRTIAGDPLVTVAIPAYSPRFFAKALDSALAQTYANLEVVVCDDARDDAIEALVRAAGPGRTIRYARNATRLGVRANYVECFETARGEFIKFLCDDDVLAPTCVAAFVDAFRRVPDLTLATSRRLRIDAADALLPDQPATLPILETDAVIAGATLANAMLMSGLNMIGEPSTALFRKADLEHQRPALFNFDGAHGHGVIDMVMWSALLMQGDAVYLCEPQSAFRVHSGQRQHDPATQQRNVASIRSLQAAWMSLELDRRIPPHQLLTQPYPPLPDADWTPAPVHSFTPRPVPAPAPSPRPTSAGMIVASRTENRAGDKSQIELERASHHGEEARKQ